LYFGKSSASQQGEAPPRHGPKALMAKGFARSSFTRWPTPLKDAVVRNVAFGLRCPCLVPKPRWVARAAIVPTEVYARAEGKTQFVRGETPTHSDFAGGRASDPLAARSRLRPWRPALAALDFGTQASPARHQILSPIGSTDVMILIAFTLSLCAAAALIVGLGAVVSVETPAGSTFRGDVGLI
jgi:hypothetical protein